MSKHQCEDFIPNACVVCQNDDATRIKSLETELKAADELADAANDLLIHKRMGSNDEKGLTFLDCYLIALEAYRKSRAKLCGLCTDDKPCNFANCPEDEQGVLNE